MDTLLPLQRSVDWRPFASRFGIGLLSIVFLAACVERPSTGLDDVDDIPIPSQNIADDDDDSAATDDDDAASDDDDSAAGDDDDSVVSDDDDSTGDDDDDATPEPTSPVSYTITDVESLLYVQVFKDPNTIFSGLAHDHVMRATNWTGSFVYDPADLSSCSLNISIPVDDILVDEDAMRSYVGYGDTIGSSDRSTIRQNMLSTDQLNSASFSQISVAAQSCGVGSGSGTTNGYLEVNVDMVLRGVTQSKSVILDLTIQGDEAYLQGNFSLTATEFGFSPYQFLGGGVRNLDQMDIAFDMVGFATN